MVTRPQLSALPNGKHHFGHGLYLYVRGGSRLWLLIFMRHGRRYERSLGSLADLTLPQARSAAQRLRKELAAATPLPARGRRRTSGLPSGSVPFRAAAEQYAASRNGAWSPKHSREWLSAMRRHVFPSIGDKLVTAVTLDDVIAILGPLWSHELGRRLRGRISKVIASALPSAECINPAELKDWLRGRLLGVPVHRPMPSMPYVEVPALLARLLAEGSRAALAVAFTILTAARRGEVLGMTWAEIDFDARLWTVPADRMKAGREHRVPLSEPALRVLDLAPTLFGVAQWRPLYTLQRFAPGVTLHGMRASFATWAEDAGYPPELIERALAHRVGGKTTQAYLRSDSLVLRMPMMTHWGRFLLGQP